MKETVNNDIFGVKVIHTAKKLGLCFFVKKKNQLSFF